MTKRCGQKQTTSLPFFLSAIVLLVVSTAQAEESDSIRAGAYVHVADPERIVLSYDEKGLPEHPVVFEEYICLADCGPAPILMEYVLVLRTYGDFVLVEYEGYYGPMEQWYLASLLIPSDAFEPLDYWSGSETFVICDEATGCFQIQIDGDANYEWNRIAYFNTNDRSLVDCGESCKYSGRLEAYENHLRMRVGSSYEVFVVGEYGELCWAKALEYFGICAPSRGAYVDE